MNNTNINSAQHVKYPKGLTVGKLYAFLGAAMAIGKEHVPVFLSDGSDYGHTLALGSVRLDEKYPEAHAPVIPENRFESVVVDYLQSMDDGYVCLSGSNPALSLEQLDMVYEKMVKRTEAANDPVVATGNVDAELESRNTDPFDNELTVGSVQELIRSGLANGTLTEDSPFRIHVDNYVVPSALTLRVKDDRSIAEPIDEQENAALKTYARCNVNHVLIHGDACRFDNDSMNSHLNNMRDRAAAIPTLAVKMPLAA